MKYVAVPSVIALSAAIALADPPILRIDPSPRTPPEQQATPPPQPVAPPPAPPMTPPRPLPNTPTPLSVPTSSSPGKATPADDSDGPDRPGWTGVVAGAGLGTLTPPSMMQPQKRSYVAVGMEVHWEYPHSAFRPGVILRPDLLMIPGADEFSGSRPRFDLGALVAVGYGDGAFVRIAGGPLATYNAVIKGVDRLRGGVVGEAMIGWRRIGGIYAETRKTWGNDITDLAYTVGVRLDLALLGRLN